MTTLLPAVTANSFGQYLECKPCAFHSPVDLTSPTSPKSITSLRNFLPYRQRQFSPVSQRSIASAPDESNDENLSPLSKPQQGWLEAVLKSASIDRTDSTQQRPTLRARKRDPAGPVVLHKRQSSQDIIPPFRVRQQTLFQLTQSPKHHFQNDTPTSAKQKGCTAVSKTCHYESASAVSTTEHSSESLEPFPLLENKSMLSDSAGLRSVSEQQVGHPLELQSTFDLTPRLNTIDHRHRPSSSSSGFVHTIKTASMSNASFSIVPRSIRFGRSSESHGFISGYSRHSLDSDRPVADSSLDEAAFLRGLKRKQIINELIMTEESYVADLKALLYLYSTLLVSATTISSHLRTAIQRNVTELLQLHETLLASFQQATFRAAARKWAATERPSHLNLTHQVRRNNNGLNLHTGVNGKHRRIRSSIDSADVAKAHIVVGAAEPLDVLDIADVFDSNIANLFAYEEYCANHEIIAHELQRHLPSLWSTYESGMESLSKSLMALNQRKLQNRKGLTVGDLLIKPVQRICKYPLLLEDLIRHTPVADSPTAHRALDNVLCQFRNIVRTVNLATDDHHSRMQIQRKWLLHDRLQLHNDTFSQAQFRTLGSVQLCGVLYLTYQDVALDIQGNYAACVLFDSHFLIAIPTLKSSRLDPVAVVSLSDLRVESATSGNGLQSLSSLHTWKVKFTANNDLYEILLTACAKAESEQWRCGLQGRFRPRQYLQLSTMFDQSRMLKDIKAVGTAFRPFTPLSQSLSPQQGVVPSDCASSCQVILRNTYNPQDWQELRNVTPFSVDRSQIHSTKNRVVVLVPKRVERTKLENSLEDIYTKNRLPFPGMIGSTGSQIIRASAGSLVRKLSFASMQASFSRRSASLSSKKSYHTIHTVQRVPATFATRKRSLDEHTPSRHSRPKELPELDTMDSVIGRMMSGGPTRKRLSFSNGDKLIRKNTKTGRSRRDSRCDVGPEDPAMVFYKDDGHDETTDKDIEDLGAQARGDTTEDGLNGTKKKRWSNPITKLRGFKEGWR